jgi:hypothetical protein
MHRRILGLAHVAELDGIADPDLRAPIEARCLRLGRDLVLNRRRISASTRCSPWRGPDGRRQGMKVDGTHYRSIWQDEAARARSGSSTSAGCRTSSAS